MDYITCQFVCIINFRLLALTRSCLTQDFTDMSDTCKGCEKRSIFALKRHQRAEQAWHQQISAQLWLSELGSPWPVSPLDDCEECSLWIVAILHLMLSGDTLVSEDQEEKFPPTPRGPWHSFRTKARPAVDTHSQSCGWLARPCLCLPWNWKLPGPFLMTNHCLYVFRSPWRWGNRNNFLMILCGWPCHLRALNLDPVQTNTECGLNLSLTKCCNKCNENSNCVFKNSI